MQKALVLFLAIFGFTSFAQNDSFIATAKQRCAPEKDGDPAVYRDDFKWGYSVEKMAETYDFIYNSGKRLPKRAYYDAATDTFYMKRHGFGNEVQKVALTEDFLLSISQHIEEGLKRDYVQYVFFPDMGHAHVFIPEDYYANVLQPIDDQGLQYQTMFAHPEIKLLYHTAEQLHMKDMETKELANDDFLRWRYYTRNLVGTMKPPARVEIHKKLHGNFNTVHDHDGHKYWGAGFDISASKDGCFPFKTKSGEIHYFDLSLHSLEADPGKEQDWGPYSGE